MGRLSHRPALSPNPIQHSSDLLRVAPWIRCCSPHSEHRLRAAITDAQPRAEASSWYSFTRLICNGISFPARCFDLVTPSLRSKLPSMTYIIMVVPLILSPILFMIRVHLSIGPRMIGSFYDHTGQKPVLKARVSDSSRCTESEVHRTPEDR